MRRIGMVLSGQYRLAAALAATAWIASGSLAENADGPRNSPSFSSEQRSFWSFQVPQRPLIPAVHDRAWIGNPIDAFILAKLEANGLRPSPPADKQTLIRRVTLDLIGLPPTPDEVDEFLADSAPDAYKKVVDRLLASPRYGERWARSWLDLARYAESDGFKTDAPRPNAWRYRDYVIESLNSDKPYDQFVREQIAGDEIDPENPAAIIATGFNRHWADEDNARNLVLRRQEILNDITDTTASVFLGLTLACARCHDHKYDPILQKDYYRFQAFFAAVQPNDLLAGSNAEQAEYSERLKAWEEATSAIRLDMASIEEPVRGKMRQETVDKFVLDVQKAVATDPAQRTPLEKQLANMAEQHLEITTDAMVNRMAKDERDRWTKLRDQLKEFDTLKPPSLPLAMALSDVGAEAPKTYLLRRGIYDAPDEQELEPGFLSILDPSAAQIPTPGPSAGTTGRRTVLAHWIANPENPFTARVMVNRLWQGHFGRGIVASAADFGFQGDPPTHPELLDWLATELVAQGWSLKAMHRLMVTSNTYRQASGSAERGTRNAELDVVNTGSGKGSPPSAPSSELRAPSSVDPDNTLLGHMNRQRLDGEILRDAILATSGQLNLKPGGPSVFPELPPGISERYGWKVSDDPAQRNRRSIYVFVRRNLRYPLFALFDMPDTNETCARRNRTTTAPQALYLLNSELILGQARAFAGRVLEEAGTERRAAIVRAYRLAFARDPQGDEMVLASDFLHRQAKFARERALDPAALALPTPMPDGYDPLEGAALTDFCHALLDANEFIYAD